MMLASSNPDDTGPVVINGAPMSYWGGAWEEGEGDNPMRYAGGALGGTWLASFTSDLAGGKFDGAWLVQNFDSLNPANTFWDKYYHVFANADTEPPRFLEFERWYGRLLPDEPRGDRVDHPATCSSATSCGRAACRPANGGVFDLRAMKMPIILFASMGDNITPPEQAFNWVADVYGSTEEIKARGQVIVGLVHKNIGHLGIFVSGKVAKKEHAQIVNVMECVEALAPGLYAMQITDRAGADGKPSYEVHFDERRLEDVGAAPQPLQARRRAALRGGGRGLGDQPARLRDVRPAAGAGDVQRDVRQAAAHVPSAAIPALGAVRPEPGHVVAQPAAEMVKQQRKRSGRRPPAAPERAAHGRAHQRSTGLLPRRARRDQRSDVLPAVRQPVLAVPGRQAGTPAAARTSRTRASCRSSRRRSPPSTRAAMRRRPRASPSCCRARASRCRSSACSSRRT